MPHTVLLVPVNVSTLQSKKHRVQCGEGEPCQIQAVSASPRLLQRAETETFQKKVGIRILDPCSFCPMINQVGL